MALSLLIALLACALVHCRHRRLWRRWLWQVYATLCSLQEQLLGSLMAEELEAIERQQEADMQEALLFESAVVVMWWR